MKWIGSPVAEIWPFAYLGAYGTPILGEGEALGGVSEDTIRKSDGSFLQALYCDHCALFALSVTIRPQFAIECLRRSNQQGVGHFGPKFGGVPLGVDP